LGGGEGVVVVVARALSDACRLAFSLGGIFARWWRLLHTTTTARSERERDAKVQDRSFIYTVKSTLIRIIILLRNSGGHSLVGAGQERHLLRNFARDLISICFCLMSPRD
jgi:hypothetical protein